ncbi:MAG: glycosyltransferase [Kiritimatiellae bacterium]|nr:glycosyltransferase [Kiritimatiellia bacterium]
MKPAPIALFVYNRPVHTRKTVEALLANTLSRESDLIVFSDAPKTNIDAKQVDLVRNYIQNIRGFNTIKIHKEDTNQGLANSIINGVTETLTANDRIIVLEDDIITSPHFLEYMNSGLALYKDNDSVISIHAYRRPTDIQLPETFFLAGADCWGWATWRRGWDLFEPDGELLLQRLKTKHLLKRFNYDGTGHFLSLLKKQTKGTIDSWAIRWYASALINGKFTLHPGRSLVANIGIDGSGTHCSNTNEYHVEVASKPVIPIDQPVRENMEAYHAMREFLFNLDHGPITGTILKIKRILGLI